MSSAEETAKDVYRTLAGADLLATEEPERLADPKRPTGSTSSRRPATRSRSPISRAGSSVQRSGLWCGCLSRSRRRSESAAEQAGHWSSGRRRGAASRCHPGGVRRPDVIRHRYRWRHEHALETAPSVIPSARITHEPYRWQGRRRTPTDSVHPWVPGASGRIRAGGVRRYEGAVCGVRRRGSAPVAQGVRPWLADRRVLDAAVVHPRTVRPRVGDAAGSAAGPTRSPG